MTSVKLSQNLGPMMLLDRFSYYFSVKGREGGLFSLTFEFLPDATLAEQDNVKMVKQIVKDDFVKLEVLLDELFFSDLLMNVKKTPVLSDSPYILETGYDYEGRGKSPGTRVRSFMRNVFPFFFDRSKKPGVMIAPIDRFTRLSANLSCRFVKDKTEKNPPVISVKLSLGHEVNLSMFRALLTLPPLRLSQHAQSEVNRLQQVLALGRDIDPRKQLESS